jgi:hypothetical protein
MWVWGFSRGKLSTEALMKNNVLVLAVCGTALLLSGCASVVYRNAATQIQTTNPHAALEYAALAIQLKPDDPKTRLMLDGLIKAISRDHESRIALMRHEEAYDEAVAECDRVIASSHLVSSLPGGNTVLFHEERERAELAELAAEKNYRMALEYESQKQPRDAVDAYCRALGFRAAYRDAEKRRADVLESSTTKLFVVFEGPKDQEGAQQLLAAVGPTALASRPRFLQLVQAESNATSKCIVRIDSTTIDDTGWVGTSLKRDTEAYQVVDKKTGQVKNYPDRHVDGTLKARTLECTVSATFTVIPIRATDPQPTGTATAQARDSKRYVEGLQGDVGLLPAEIVSLPREPVALRDPDVLKIECVRGLAKQLGEQLFMAYK